VLSQVFLSIFELFPAGIFLFLVLSRREGISFFGGLFCRFHQWSVLCMNLKLIFPGPHLSFLDHFLLLCSKVFFQ